MVSLMLFTLVLGPVQGTGTWSYVWWEFKSAEACEGYRAAKTEAIVHRQDVMLLSRCTGAQEPALFEFYGGEQASPAHDDEGAKS